MLREATPRRVRSGRTLAVAGATAPLLNEGVRFGAGFAGAGTGVSGGAGVSTTCAVSTLVCATPAAESTHAFMFVIDARAELSVRARCTATTAAFAESVLERDGAMNAVNCACAAIGVSAARTIVKHAARNVT